MRQQENFKIYIEGFSARLENISPGAVSQDLYCKEYLAHLLQHKKYYLSIYADVLQKIIARTSMDKAEIRLLDYGCGNGLLGLFAKFCGFGRVWLNDADNIFLEAATSLASQLNIVPDGCIAGDIDGVKKYFVAEVPNSVAGTDVIEHIYDLPHFFSALKEMNNAMVSVFTTASNPANFFKLRALKKIQLRDELLGSESNGHFSAGGNVQESFLNTRKRIIKNYYPSITESELSRLATFTRGLNEPDIKMAVDRFIESGQLPSVPGNANTCDPLTGSWTERILSFEAYSIIYREAGFNCRFYNGFYNSTGTGFKNFAKKLLNLFIPITGKKISPYIVLVGFNK